MYEGKRDIIFRDRIGYYKFMDIGYFGLFSVVILWYVGNWWIVYWKRIEGDG